MVVLKKIKAATIVESLVSSALILIVFVFASLSLNNVFKTAVNQNDRQLNQRVHELQYLHSHGLISLPFYDDNPNWEIEITQQEEQIVLEWILKRNSNSKTIILK